MLDLSITNIINNKCEFKVHRKDVIPNIHGKLNPCILAYIIKGFLKGFLHDAHSLCSEKYINQNVQFLDDIFVENAHNKSFFQKTSFAKKIVSNI